MGRSGTALVEIQLSDRGSVAFRLQRSGLCSADRLGEDIICVNGSRNMVAEA